MKIIIGGNPVFIAFYRAAPFLAPSSCRIIWKSFRFGFCGDLIVCFQVAVPSVSCKRVYAFPVTHRKLHTVKVIVAQYDHHSLQWVNFANRWSLSFDKHQGTRFVHTAPPKSDVVSSKCADSQGFFCILKFCICWLEHLACCSTGIYYWIHFTHQSVTTECT